MLEYKKIFEYKNIFSLWLSPFSLMYRGEYIG